MVKLHQNIDTLKIHFYPALQIEEKYINDYNNFIDKLICIKKLASEEKNKYKEYRYHKVSRFLTNFKFYHLLFVVFRFLYKIAILQFILKR